MPVLNPEDEANSKQLDGDSSSQWMDSDLECLYNNVQSADDAEN